MSYIYNFTDSVSRNDFEILTQLILNDSQSLSAISYNPIIRDNSTLQLLENSISVELNETIFVKPSGFTTDGILYSKNSLQFGTTLKLFYQNTFLKDSKGKGRIGLTSSLTLFSDYLNKPQFVDIEFLVNTNFYIFKGLSISFGSILFYDYDVLVQLNTDKDNNTGINGYETTGRGVSFTQTLLIKYNFLF
jgi:hypothetical protein